jgi:ATP-binding cassette, subfamily B, bacterial
VTGSSRERGGLARAAATAIALAWRASKVLLAVQFVTAVAAGIAPVAAAWLLRAILDQLTARHPHDLVPLVLLLGLTGAVTAVSPDLQQYARGQIGRALTREVTTTLFGAVIRVRGLRRLEDPRFRDRLRVAEQAGSAGPGQVVTAGFTIVKSAITLVGFLGALLTLSPAMAGVLAVAAVPAVFLQRDMARRQAGLMHGISHSQRRQFFYASLLTDLAAAKEIRLFGLGRFFRTRMLRELADAQRAGQRLDQRQLAVSIGLSAVAAVTAAGGMLWATWQTAAGRFTIGDLIVFVSATGSVATTVEPLIAEASHAYQALLLFRGYQEVLSEAPDLPAAAMPLAPAPLRSGIELENVWFRYDPGQPWVLRGVSCFIPAGQSVALVGKNGSGKSTLVKLLCRFYDPDRGRICWDGTDVRDLDLDAFRDRISVVFQDYMCYELSAAENIAVGNLHRAGLDLVGPGDGVATAARRAGIDQVISALPYGYQTLLTRAYFDLADKQDPKTGVLLSGGQWQRVALARAYLRAERDLIILDEPSSGLDAEAEHQIHADLAATRRGRTSVLISHRLNAIRDADQIIVLDDGVIAERGTHGELTGRPGLYARLFALQANGYQKDPV